MRNPVIVPAALLALAALTACGGDSATGPQQNYVDPCESAIAADVASNGPPTSHSDGGTLAVYTWPGMRVTYTRHWQTQADPTPNSCDIQIQLTS